MLSLSHQVYVACDISSWFQLSLVEEYILEINNSPVTREQVQINSFLLKNTITLENMINCFPLLFDLWDILNNIIS